MLGNWFPGLSNLLVVAQTELPNEVSTAYDLAVDWTNGWYGLGIGFVIASFLLFLVNYVSRAGVIARATCKESTRQPIFLFLMAVVMIVICANVWVPFFSLGEDTKMYKDCGLATILIAGMLVAVYTASNSIADEIEGKTAMTLLSKPITRWQFVVGKYLGILQTLYWLIVPMSVVLLCLTFYKTGYDLKESGRGTVEYFSRGPEFDMGSFVVWLPQPNMELLTSAAKLIPSLIMTLLESAMIAGVSVAISTRLPMVVNIVTCFAIFVVAHLTPILVKASEEQQSLELVAFVARMFSLVLPQLEFFNTSPAVSTDRWVTPDYVGYAFLYALFYCIAMGLLSLILFEDRDLA